MKTPDPAPPTLPGFDTDAAMRLVAAAADVALIVDGNGVIQDVSIASADFKLDGSRDWIGRSWEETVSMESRAKVASLLREAGTSTSRKWRHINYPSAKGGDVPVMVSAIQIGADGRIVAFGRDMRALSALQERLVAAQQSMERDYLRLRHMETRYRLLFELSSESVLIVDATTQKVAEANPAASKVLGESVKRIVGRAFADCFDAASQPAVLSMLGGVRSAGQADEVKARLASERWELTVSASLFRQENNSFFLVRLAPTQADSVERPNTSNEAMLLKAVESVPDGFVVTNLLGQVLTANSAFIEMTQLATGGQLEGESIERWLGGAGVDLNVLLANLRQHGSVRLFSTTLRGQYGLVTPVEISATSVPHADLPCLGFSVRDIGRRLAPQAKRGARELPRSAAQLTELVGRVPLRDIVGETTDLIEQLCIEAALELTSDNRASASEMLGLSRQSLYVKLRRYGLGDLGGGEGDK